jgi:hypothetical protein
MPATLSCTISKIAMIPSKVNADIIAEYREYMCDNGASERHQNNALKAVIGYAKFLSENTTFCDIAKEQITAYLDTKINSTEQDPDKKWITTWNDNLHRIKHLFRWLYNQRGKDETIPVHCSAHSPSKRYSNSCWQSFKIYRIKPTFDRLYFSFHLPSFEK